jgi:hypothetical protein
MLEFPRKKGEEKVSSNRAYTAAREEKRLWYGAVIPYVIDCSLSKCDVFFHLDTPIFNDFSPNAK